MGKLVVNARLVVEDEYVTDDTGDGPAIDRAARQRLLDSVRSVDGRIGDGIFDAIVVTVEPEEWLSEGRFATGDKRESEDDMLARMQREAEEAAGLV